jgi:diacylglycerol kinase (ATP)
MAIKTLFIINPIAGNGKQKKILPLIDKYLDKSKFSYDIKFTEYHEHALAIVSEAKEHYEIIVAVGGDGSVNQIGSMLIDSPCIMGIIPSGSGNGLARHLEIPLSFKGAINLINNYKKGSKIDIGVLNNRFFTSTAGIGFDAHVGWKFSKASKRGFLTYVKITLKELFNYKLKEYQLISDKQPQLFKALLVTVANSNQYGNNAYISPNSKLNDGYLRVLVVHPFPFYAAPGLVLKLFSKRILSSKYVTEYRLKKMTLISPSEEVQMDGEPYLMPHELNISILKQSLNIIGNINLN